MSSANKDLVRRWFDEVWNKGRADAVDELLSERAVVHGLAGDLHGPAGFKTFHTAYRNAFPDVVLHLDAMVEEGNLVAARWSGTATHRGDGLGFAATGKPVSFTGMTMLRIENGELVEGWNSFDEIGMLRQLGIVK